MTLSVSEQCRSCLVTLQEVISVLSKPGNTNGHVKHAQINEELDRFSLFVGNIGALHRPESSMSIESRLHKANDVLTHILDLLADLNEVAAELLEIVSGKREGSVFIDGQISEEISEVNELREEISGAITRLFRVSILIRQAAPTDLFAKALSRNRYCFNDQFDIAHVGEKYRKLGTDNCAWLRQRLGRAITQRRHYLNYIQDHHGKLGGRLIDHDKADSSAARSQAPDIKQPPASKTMFDSVSRPSFITKATTIAPERITPQLLVAEGSDSEEDARSYTTISRSIDGDHESHTTVRSPKLDDLRIGGKKEFECPFCFRIKKFKRERTWRKHVFSDLRAYVCTFPDCDAPYFGDINEWFQHEMMVHRVSYQCFLCPSTVFYQEEKYLSHVKRKHAKMLFDGEEQPGRDLARKPLAQIPVDDCPCCSDWADRLKEQAIQTGGSLPNDILAVVPTVFKRHLAGHLEQLALFAIPIGAATDDDKTSNAAIEETKSKRTDPSQRSTLIFASSRGDTDDTGPEPDPSKSKVLHADIEDTQIIAGPENDAPGSPPSEPSKLGDQDGADQPSYLARMAVLSETLRDAGQWQDAEKLEVQVFEKSKQVLGPEHPDTLASMYNLARALEIQDKYAEAEVMYMETIKVYKTVKLGSAHPPALMILSDLARVLSLQGKDEEAIAWQAQELTTCEKVFGPEHPNTMMSVNNLGNLCLNQGQFNEAEMMYQRALQGKEKALGPEHISTLDTVNHLGDLYRKLGRLEEAERMYQRVLQGREKVLGPEHTSTIHIVSDLGILYEDFGRLDEAERMYQRALQGREKALGLEHTETLVTVDHLGNLYKKLGRLEEAERMYQRVLQGREKALGPEHVATLNTVNDREETITGGS
ncbi:uncharacterized protein N0V89_008945 [Didymosphaeria variabile]|uniref:C2H2-type domain-containing protein n=1 Tax=Didymosphaeria variabile TaxID=1932322 RepID=A0A9W8XIM9_9PLEO|nr:uncharacterized protein N0V89_008945 [Didymosphaeria variabile]KAJ4350324.1 hypothetical protein N0V89_008945 [Didymosphaeria variabile]